jgi:hypothetical protein
MSGNHFTFGAALVCVPALVMLVRHYWVDLAVTGAAGQRVFLRWLAKGLGVPLVLWAVLAAGAIPGMPPFCPRFLVVQAAGGGGWVGVFLGDAAPGWVALASWWASFSILWLGLVLWREVESRRELLILAGAWSAVSLPVLWLVITWAGWGGLGLAGLIWGLPVLHFVRPFSAHEEPPPSYARAIAKLKFGRYQEAEQEVLGELERSTEDFEGWMLLAELYATRFHDLAAADRTVRELCSQPNLNETQISIALNRLADWHLSPGDDPVAARRALEAICRQLPGTLADRGARQRIASMPASREELRERRQPRALRLPALGDALDQTVAAGEPAMAPAEARRQADLCVEKLRANPNDPEARERFATLLAAPLGQVDLALEQLGLLLQLQEAPGSKRAEWLAQMAAWQLQLKSDAPAASATLRRLIQEFPETVQAFAAQRRLNLIAMDEQLARLRSAQARQT